MNLHENLSPFGILGLGQRLEQFLFPFINYSITQFGMKVNFAQPDVKFRLAEHFWIGVRGDGRETIALIRLTGQLISPNPECGKINHSKNSQNTTNGIEVQRLESV